MIEVSRAKRGKEPFHYFTVSVSEDGEAKRFVGYIVRTVMSVPANPGDEDRWAASVRQPGQKGGAPMVIEGPSADQVFEKLTKLYTLRERMNEIRGQS